MRRNKMIPAAALLLSLALTACRAGRGGPAQGSGGPAASAVGGQTADTSVLGTGLPTVEYSDRDLSGEYDDRVTEITLGGGDVVVTQPGTYILSGTLADGQVRVEAGSADKVQLVLNDASITNRNGPAVYVKTADKVFLTLAAGTKNFLTDGADYDTEGDENEPDGCVFSQADLTINGSGSLTVTGQYSHGVITKDDLTITGGAIRVTAANEGLKGRDAVQICGGVITVDAADDAVSASNEEDGGKGWVSIDGGDLDLSADGNGIHAEGALVINGGTIRVRKSAEGLEGRSVTLTGGDVTIDASDDGVNAAGGVGGTAGSSAQDGSANYIHVAGGSLWVNAQGDGLDSNGLLAVSGGTVYVSQSGDGDGALDADGGLVVTGGTVVAAGSAQMAAAFGASSTQYSFLYRFDGAHTAGTALTVTDGEGNELVRFAPERDYECVVVSVPALAEGTYTVAAGEETGTITLTGVSSSNGASPAGGFGGPGGQRPGDQDPREDPAGMEPTDQPERPAGSEPPSGGPRN